MTPAHDETSTPHTDVPLIAIGQAILGAQPFNSLIGARITHFMDGEAVLEVDIADHHRQQFGVVHGGVLAYLVDNTLTFACGTVLGTEIITGGLTVTYLASAREGTLRATAAVTAHHGRRAVANVTIDEIGPDGTVRTCAVGQGTAVSTAKAA